MTWTVTCSRCATELVLQLNEHRLNRRPTEGRVVGPATAWRAAQLRGWRGTSAAPECPDHLQAQQLDMSQVLGSTSPVDNTPPTEKSSDPAVPASGAGSHEPGKVLV